MDNAREVAAEALAAVTGIQAILAPSPKPVGMKQGREAMALPRRIEEMLRAFLAQDGPRRQDVDLPKLDYLETLETLTAPITQPQREALMADFEDPELALAYAGVLERGVAWLLEQLPRRARQSIVGDIPVEPSHTEMALFERQWQVAADPMQVLRDMGEGILVTDQVEAMTAMFPLLYQLVVDTTLRLLAELHAGDDGTWEPDWFCQKGLFTLLGISPVDPQFAAQLQTQAKQAAQAEAAGAQMQIDLRGGPADAETPTQRLSG
jgi:hypothetical protein